MYFFQTQADFKKNSLNCIDDTFMEAKKILKDITNDHRECLQELSLSRTFVLWVKKELEGTVDNIFVNES